MELQILLSLSEKTFECWKHQKHVFGYARRFFLFVLVIDLYE